MREHAVRRFAAGAAVLAVALLASGCGSSANHGTNAASSGGTGVSAAKAIVASLEKPTESFKAPGPAIDAKSLAGKSVWYVPISISVPVFAIANEALHSALSKVGVQLHTCSGNADPSATAACIEHAIASKAAGIIVDAIPVALAANAVSLVVLSRGRSESLNVRGAFLEVASDALGAFAVILTGVIVALTGFSRADPIAALGVGALILPRTWRLLADAVNVLLEASPRGIDLSEVRRHLTEVDGVREIHDLHAWTITSGLPVLSVHVVVEPAVLASGRSAVMLDTLQACLRGHFDVEHSTFQLEPAGHAEHELPMHQ